jgi:Mn-dependent DtxR family transcriptional regulator
MSSTKKVVLCQIISLSSNRKCTASNGRIGSMLGMNKSTISKAIHELVEEGYLKSTTFTEYEETKRWLSPTQKTINLITKGLNVSEEFEKSQPEEAAPGIEDSHENYSYDIKALIKKLKAEEYGF